jgi:hypothetical protein
MHDYQAEGDHADPDESFGVCKKVMLNPIFYKKEKVGLTQMR